MQSTRWSSINVVFVVGHIAVLVAQVLPRQLQMDALQPAQRAAVQRFFDHLKAAGSHLFEKEHVRTLAGMAPIACENEFNKEMKSGLQRPSTVNDLLQASSVS